MLLIDYNNRAFTTTYSTGTTTTAYWSNHFFGTTDGAKTANNYYSDMSGSFNFQFTKPTFTVANDSTFSNPITGVSSVEIKDGVARVRLNKNHPNTTLFGGTVEADISLVFNAVKQYINFSDIPRVWGTILCEDFNVTSVIAGYEGSTNNGSTPRIWAHASWSYFSDINGKERNISINCSNNVPNELWTYAVHGEMYNSSNVMGMGISAHELGHVLGLPDLYDSGGSATSGLGIYSLMAGGSWGYMSGDGIPGRTPTAFDAWSKARLGFVTPTTIPSDQYQKYNVNSVENGYNAIKLTSSVDSYQYFLVENRQITDWDRGMSYYGSSWPGISSPTGGIVIYQVDEYASGNSNSSHRMVNVLGSTTSGANSNNSFYAANLPNTTSPRNLLHDTTTPNSRFYPANSPSSTTRNVVSGITLRVNSNNGASMEVEFGNGIVVTLPNLVFNTSNMFTFSQIKFITTSGYYSKTIYYVLRRSRTQIASGSAAINATGNATLTITQQQFSASQNIEILIYGDSANQTLITRQIVRPTLFQF